jgi:hypothetical protein
VQRLPVHCQQQESAEADCKSQRRQVEQAADQNGGQALVMPVPVCSWVQQKACSTQVKKCRVRCSSTYENACVEA